MSAQDWSAAQHRHYTDQADDAVITMAAKNASIDPSNTAALGEQLDKLDKAMEQQAQDKGWSPETLDAKKYEAKSAVLTSAIHEWAQTKPFAAQNYFYKIQDKLAGPDRAKLLSFIRDQTRTVGPRMIVSDLRSGRDISLGERKVTMDQAKIALGNFESGNHYWSKGVETIHGRALGRYQVMEEFLGDYLKRAGLPMMSAEDFLNSPNAQDQVFERVFGGYMETYGSFNEAASRWFTGKSIAQARLQGRHDAHGTTVDTYLARTNAELGRMGNQRMIEDAAQKRAREMDPEGRDPMLADYVSAAVAHHITNDKQMETQTRNEAAGAVLNRLSAVGPNGELIKGKEELLNTPDLRQQYERLTDAQKRAVDEHLTANIRGGFAPTEANQQRYVQLLGGLSTREGQADFSAVDLMAEKLPNNQYQQLLKIQNQIKLHAEDEPRVAAVRDNPVIKQALTKLGYDQRKNDPEGYDRLMGQIYQLMENEKNLTGIQTPVKRGVELATDLLKTQKVPGLLWSNDVPFFSRPPQNTEERAFFSNLMKTEPDFADMEHEDQIAAFRVAWAKMLAKQKREAQKPARSSAIPVPPATGVQ